MRRLWRWFWLVTGGTGVLVASLLVPFLVLWAWAMWELSRGL